MATTETVEFLFRTRGLEGLAEELDKTAGRADKASREVDDLRGELDRLRRSANRAADSSERVSAGIRGIEGAGRALGGPLGEYAGILGDFEAVAEGAAGALGPAGIIGAFGLLAAVAVPTVIFSTLSALTDLSRASVSARDELEKLGGLSLVTPEGMSSIEQLEQGLNRLDAQFNRLLVELAPSLVPVIDMITNAVTRLAGASAVASQQLSGLTAQDLGEMIGGGVGSLAGFMAQSVAGLPFGAELGNMIGGMLGGALTAPTSFTLTPPTSGTPPRTIGGGGGGGGGTPPRTIGGGGVGGRGAPVDPTLGIAFDTKTAEFTAAADELILASINLSTGLGGLNEPLQSASEAAADFAFEIRENVLTAVGGIIGQFGGGAAGGARLGQEVLENLLAEIPIIGGFLSEILDALLDLPSFIEGLWSFVEEAPEKILVGIAKSIGNFGKLFSDTIPKLIAGIIEGVAMILVSPVAMVEGIIRGIGQLPKTLVRELTGLPVRLLQFVDPDENGLFRGPEGRVLGIPGTERPDRTPVSGGAPQATGSGGPGRPLPKGGTPAAVAMSTGGSAVLIGGWAEAVDSLGVAMRTRRSFGGGNLGP